MNASTIAHLEVTGLWGHVSASVPLQPDVNILYGENGTGKTTLLRLLSAALEVNTPALHAIKFSSLRLELVGAGHMVVEKRSHDDRHTIRYIGPGSMEYEFGGEATANRADAGPDVKEWLGRYMLLSSLRQTVPFRWLPSERYQSEKAQSSEQPKPSLDAKLADQAPELKDFTIQRNIERDAAAKNFLQDALLSLLDDASAEPLWPLKSELTDQEALLQGVFSELHFSQDRWRPLLHKHFQQLRHAYGDDTELQIIEHRTLLAHHYLRKIIGAADAFKDAQARIEKPRQIFTELCAEFFREKTVLLTESGDLFCYRGSGLPDDPEALSIQDLSSGEKHLLIAFVDALLQNAKRCLYIVDEPEISLHVKWQDRWIGAMRRLNPNCQLIIATHSPDIVGSYRDSMIDIADVQHED